MATTLPFTFSIFVPLDGAAATIGVAEALVLLDVELLLELVVLPLVVDAAKLNELKPVVRLNDVITDFALVFEGISFSKLLPVLVAEDSGVEAGVAMVVAAVAEVIPLGLIDSMVLVLSTTNCGV